MSLQVREVMARYVHRCGAKWAKPDFTLYACLSPRSFSPDFLLVARPHGQVQNGRGINRKSPEEGKSMNPKKVGLIFATLVFAAAAIAQDLSQMKEMKRSDLSGAPGMEVVSSIGEYKPGAEIRRHTHPGVESAYVLEGAMIQVPGKDAVLLATGTVIHNLRDVPHAGFKVVGDKTLKLATVHIVDKGKPMYNYDVK
jgi:quercetin dioxygenase-like cupin family protein